MVSQRAIAVEDEPRVERPSSEPPLIRRPAWRFRISTLLIVILLIAIVLAGWRGLVVPARRSINDAMCHNNLHKLYYSLREYDYANGSLPPAYVNGSDGTPSHSWRVLILPYLDPWGIDAGAIYQAYDFNEPWDGPNNRSLPRPVAESRFACPGGAESGTTLTSYVVPVGPGTLFPGPDAVALSDVPETVDPILVIEITRSDIQWTEPRDLLLSSVGGSEETNSVRLSGSHFGSIRYITASGKLGVLPPGTSIDEIRRLAQSGIPAVGNDKATGTLDEARKAVVSER